MTLTTKQKDELRELWERTRYDDAIPALLAENEELRKLFLYVAEGEDCWCGEGCHQMPPEDRNDNCEAIRKLLEGK